MTNTLIQKQQTKPTITLCIHTYMCVFHACKYVKVYTFAWMCVMYVMYVRNACNANKVCDVGVCVN